MIQTAKPFYKWTSRELVEYFQGLDRKIKIKLILIGLGIAVFIPFIFWPSWIARFQNEGQIRQLRHQIDSAQAQIRQEPQLLEQKKNYEAFIAETASHLFTQSDIQRLLGILNELGQRTKVKLLSSQPESESGVLKVPEPFNVKYMARSYLISVEGGYHALASFVSEIESYPKILRIEEFSITPNEETPESHTAEIRLSAFLERERT